MAASLIVILDTPTPIWAARQFVGLVKELAEECGYSVPECEVSHVTMMLSPAAEGDSADLERFKAALEDSDVLKSISLREDEE